MDQFSYHKNTYIANSLWKEKQEFEVQGAETLSNITFQSVFCVRFGSIEVALVMLKEELIINLSSKLVKRTYSYSICSIIGKLLKNWSNLLYVLSG